MSGTASATCIACALTLVGLLCISWLSRMSMSESVMGAYGREQMLRSIKRIHADAQTQIEMSRQDTDPVIALMHNAEASSHLRAAKRLAEESGVLHTCKINFIDLMATLAQEQDVIMRDLTERLPNIQALH